LQVYRPEEPVDRDAARSALVARLLQSAKAARKDWRAYLIQDGGATEDRSSPVPLPPGAAVPKPDLTITDIFAADSSTASGNGLLLPITHKMIGEMAADLDGTDAANTMTGMMRDISPIVVYSMMLGSEGLFATNRTIPMVLYDFRDAPNLITDSLKWVKPPAK
jgi:hypothetical protein